MRAGEHAIHGRLVFLEVGGEVQLVPQVEELAVRKKNAAILLLENLFKLFVRCVDRAFDGSGTSGGRRSRGWIGLGVNRARHDPKREREQ